MVAAALALAMAAVGVGAAPAAHAAEDAIVVTSMAGLRAAVDSPCTGVTPTSPRKVVAGINILSIADSEPLRVRCDIDFDLSGRTVATGAISVTSGRTLHLMSSTGGGILRAYAGWDNPYRAGIGTAGATLIIDGVTVQAQGADGAAGIGGGGVMGYGNRTAEGGGTISIVNGAQVTATSRGEGRGAGIGGGAAFSGGDGLPGVIGATARGGNGGTITISGAGTRVTARSVLGAGIGGGNGAGWNSSATGGRGGLGATIVIEDGAQVTAESQRGAGIGGGTGTGYGTTYAGEGGHVTVTDATVSALSHRGAGIGSGDATERGAHGGTVIIDGASDVTARALENGSGIGTGRLGANDNSQNMELRIGEGSRVRIDSASNSALRLDRGRAQIDGELRVRSSELRLGSGQFSVSETGRIVAAPLSGSYSPRITGSGTIVNDGAIVMHGVGSGVRIERNNFSLRFERAGGGAIERRIYAPTFASAEANIPQPVSGHEWNSEDDGAGAALRTSTPIVPDFMSEDDHAENDGSTAIRVYEVPAADGGYELQVAAPDIPVVAGEPFTLDARVVDAVGDVEDDEPELALEGTAHGVSMTPEGTLIATVAGSVEVLVATVHDGETLTALAAFEVHPAAATTMEIDPSTAAVINGGSVEFTVTAHDAFGNLVSIPDLVLSSPSPWDTVNGTTVTMGTSGTRTITARSVELGLQAQAVVTAYHPDTRYGLRVVGAPGEVVAGEEFFLGTEVFDRITGDTVDVAVELSWWFSDPRATIEDDEVVARTAGTLNVTAIAKRNNVEFFAQATIQVLPAALASLELTPGTGVVFEGESTTFEVAGFDAFGNSVHTDGVTLSSSDPSDDVTGLTVTMHDVGTRTITATSGGVSESVPFTVVADVERYGLVLDAPDSAAAGEAFAATATVVDVETDAPVADQPEIDWTLGGTDATRDAATGLVTATGTGPLALAATASYKGLTLGADAAVTISAGSLDEMSLVASAAGVYQDEEVSLTATGSDAFGNPVDVSGAVLTSSESTDRLDGWTLAGTRVGERVVTASMGTVEASTSVTVHADPLRYTLEIRSLPTAGTAGEPFALDAVVVDAMTGAEVAPAETSWAFGTDTARHEDGTATEYRAGVLAIHAEGRLHGLELAASASIEIEAASLAALSLSPRGQTVAEGSTIDFTVTGADAWENTVEVAQAVLTTSSSADVVRGWRVTFHGEGARTVTASIGAVQATAEVTVPAETTDGGGTDGEEKPDQEDRDEHDDRGQQDGNGGQGNTDGGTGQGDRDGRPGADPPGSAPDREGTGSRESGSADAVTGGTAGTPVPGPSVNATSDDDGGEGDGGSDAGGPEEQASVEAAPGDEPSAVSPVDDARDVSGGMSWWWWLLIALAVSAAAGGTVAYARSRRA